MLYECNLYDDSFVEYSIDNPNVTRHLLKQKCLTSLLFGWRWTTLVTSSNYRLSNPSSDGFCSFWRQESFSQVAAVALDTCSPGPWFGSCVWPGIFPVLLNVCRWLEIIGFPVRLDCTCDLKIGKLFPCHICNGKRNRRFCDSYFTWFSLCIESAGFFHRRLNSGCLRGKLEVILKPSDGSNWSLFSGSITTTTGF